MNRSTLSAKTHAMSNENVLSEEDVAEDVENTRLLLWSYYKVIGVESKRGGAKRTRCNFCDTWCSSSQAFAHILGKAVRA